MIGASSNRGFPLGYVLGSLVFALVSLPDHRPNHCCPMAGESFFHETGRSFFFFFFPV